MKSISVLVATLLMSPCLWANGKAIGNGGDANEIIFKEVALNIKQWIEAGNADQLKLSNDVTLDTYKKTMIKALSMYHISFTNEKVIVRDLEKTCLNYVGENNETYILCQSSRFAEIAKTDKGNLYRLVHHEFAGLAGFEENDGQDSDYRISNQISAYLKWETVQKLPIIPLITDSNSGKKCVNLTGVYQMPLQKYDRGTKTRALIIDQDQCRLISVLQADGGMIPIDRDYALDGSDRYKIVGDTIVDKPDGVYSVLTEHGKCKTASTTYSLNAQGFLALSWQKLSSCEDGFKGSHSEVYPRIR